jgi:CheY-like chemotaxis protein
MVEPKSRLRILVVEDNHEFALSALSACMGNDVLLATNLEEAVPAILKYRPDFILSDVHFPAVLGKEPAENIVPLMQAALEAGVPVCFVTLGDHHGLTELDEKGFVSIKPLTISGLVQTLMETTGLNSDPLRSAFSSVKSESPQVIRSAGKTREIWATALERLQHACMQAPGPVELAARAVRSATGLGIGVANGVPVLRAVRK